MMFMKICHRSLRSTCFYILSLLVLLTCATFFIYQQDLYYAPRRPFYVYEFPNENVPYPTLFMANKKKLCVPDGTVTVQSGGRLGNIIMEYASTWSLAKLYNLTAFVPQDIIYKLQTVFQPLSLPSTRGFVMTQTTCQLKRGWGSKPMDLIGTMKKIDMKLAPLDGIVHMARKRHKLLVLELCVIMVETIVPLVRELRHEFKYRSTLEAQAQKTLRELRDKLLKGTKIPDDQVSYVGVHVRRTDYKDQIRLLYNATEEAGVDYYKRALSWMRNTLSQEASGRTPHIVFVVTSDDPKWCQETLLPALQGSKDSQVQYGVYWAGQGDITAPEQDLALLSACNHSIIAYGTYGLWGALMAGGHTVVYDVTGSEANRHVRGYSPAMQFARNLDGWIAMW